jgi:hypothetical protein
MVGLVAGDSTPDVQAPVSRLCSNHLADPQTHGLDTSTTCAAVQERDVRSAPHMK